MSQCATRFVTRFYNSEILDPKKEITNFLGKQNKN